MNETVKHLIWNTEYKKRFDTKREIPSVFIDPVIDFEYAEEKEMAIFKNYTTKLFELSNSMRPYECSIYCQAPQGRASTHLIKVRKKLISRPNSIIYCLNPQD